MSEEEQRNETQSTDNASANDALPDSAEELEGQSEQHPSSQTKKKRCFVASIFPGPNHPLPEEVGESALELEKELGCPVLFLVQGEGGPYSMLDNEVRLLLIHAVQHMAAEEPIALVLDSLGGYAEPAYQIATLLRNHCGKFVVVVPRIAKSAATLLALGADEILMGRHAELGPLDAQKFDVERERTRSALDEVQSLERLHAFALDAIDSSMLLLISRTGKKLDFLLPLTLDFVAIMLKPLFEQVDVVHYTQEARALKIAEEYAIRLLSRGRYSREQATIIARHLVEKYPNHGFVIDAIEARDDIGLPVAESPKTIDDIMEKMFFMFNHPQTIIGRVQEIDPDERERET